MSKKKKQKQAEEAPASTETAPAELDAKVATPSKPARATIRNLTARALTLVDPKGRGVRVGPKATTTVRPSDVSDHMRRLAERGSIKLS